MNTDRCRTIAVTCALGTLLALPAKAEPPKTKTGDTWGTPAPAEPNLDWKRLKLTLGAPHVEGGTVPQAEADLQKLSTPLFLCYSREIAHGARLRGTADLALWLNRSGSVSNVRVTPAPGKGLAQSIVSCWSNAARAAHFERPSGDGVKIAVELQFSPERGRPEPPEPVKPKPKYSGPVIISLGQVAGYGAAIPDSSRVVAGWRSALKPCASLARGMADGGADGTLAAVNVGITVASDGKVSKVSALPGNTVAQPQPDPVFAKATTCVLESAKALKFAPHPDGEGQLQIGVVFRKP